jgi:hypothetical protein
MMIMAIELTYPHIEKSEGQSARLRRFPRIRVAHIAMDYIEHGWSVDEMCRQHPYLMPAEAHAAMAYYFDHKDEVEEEIREEVEQVARERSESPSSAVHDRLRGQGFL